MWIKKIALHNFGSYIGDNIFDFEAHKPEQRVAVIGGKNGAGKTTLFTAVQVCLYGHFTFGFKTAGKRYLKEIYELINNQIRIDEQETAFVEIAFQQVDNTDLYEYTVRRTWIWLKNDLQETLTVLKNGQQLDEDALLNFQNYLIHLIPPDMLKLYFFDGEKIADYFLGEKEVNIHDALMILSGNDTFDILYEQVKRVLKNSTHTQSNIASDYLSAKNEEETLQKAVQSTQSSLDALSAEIDETNAELDRLQKEYANHGGITIEAWKALNNQLREEEEKRERLNWQRKSYATDILPFLMLPGLISRVMPQLNAEKEYQAYSALESRLNDRKFVSVLQDALSHITAPQKNSDIEILLEKIQGYFLDPKWQDFAPLFGLSNDEEVQVKAIVSRVSEFDPRIFSRYQKRIDASLEKAKNIRQKLQATSIEQFEDFVVTQTALEGKLQNLQLKREHLCSKLNLQMEELEEKKSELRLARSMFEEHLKAQSISDISSQMLLLLEDLQDSLYSNLIRQVENDLNSKFRELIRKKDFFSRLVIDRNFIVHLLRNTEVNKADLLALTRYGNKSNLSTVLGEIAASELEQRYQATSMKDLYAKLSAENTESINLPIELDKERLSSGEKQIFVMSLYWALMNQSQNELPFIIDTPFARIDTEHRANITDHFFKKLDGQLLILSTDEEISGQHLRSMGDQISHVYMLEYGQDKKTHVYQNQYFEV